MVGRTSGLYIISFSNNLRDMLLFYTKTNTPQCFSAESLCLCSVFVVDSAWNWDQISSLLGMCLQCYDQSDLDISHHSSTNIASTISDTQMYIKRFIEHLSGTISNLKVLGNDRQVYNTNLSEVILL